MARPDLTQLRGNFGAMALLLMIIAFTPGNLAAHPELDQRIAGLTGQIEHEPDRASLYLQRGELHRRHGEFDRAFADFAEAARRDPQLDAVELARARTLLDAGKSAEALTVVARFLGHQPRHPEGLVIRARASGQEGHREAALADYLEALSVSPRPSPDVLIESARALAKSGRFADAIRVLDEGIGKIGAVPALELSAIDFERQLKRFDAALRRLDEIIARYPRPELWLALRAEVLEEAGRYDESRSTLHRALAALETQPPFRRELELIRQLEARLRATLARVETRRNMPATGTALP